MDPKLSRNGNEQSQRQSQSARVPAAGVKCRVAASGQWSQRTARRVKEREREREGK